MHDNNLRSLVTSSVVNSSSKTFFFSKCKGDDDVQLHLAHTMDTAEPFCFRDFLKNRFIYKNSLHLFVYKTILQGDCY
jgi:hypothetical protein